MNVIRVTYQSRVTAQKYVDGVPVFREEAINRWTDGELVAYLRLRPSCRSASIPERSPPVAIPGTGTER